MGKAGGITQVMASANLKIMREVETPLSRNTFRKEKQKIKPKNSRQKQNFIAFLKYSKLFVLG